jgi:hypothetical protein
MLAEDRAQSSHRGDAPGGDSSTMVMAGVQLALGSRTVTHRPRPAGLEYLETAPVRVVLQADVAASPTNVFSAIADPSTWTWFPIGVQGSSHRPRVAWCRLDPGSSGCSVSLSRDDSGL